MSALRHCRRFLLAGLALAAGRTLGAPVAGQDELGVVVEDPAEPAGPLAAPQRVVDGRDVFLRPFAEAFVDPDQRMNLEPKYYFLLNDRASDARFAEAAADNVAGGGWRLEYRGLPKSGAAVLWARLSPDSTLTISRESADPQAGEAKVVASQKLDSLPRPLGDYPLDVLDRPPRGEPGAGVLGRVIAVLKREDGRYAIDFYAESLARESIRRLWLADAAGGTPRGICFHEIAVRWAEGVKTVAVISVLYADRWVAYDFPLARPLVLDNLRKLSVGGSNAKAAAAPPVDAARLLGEDLVDEFSRRLVDAVEK